MNYELCKPLPPPPPPAPIPTPTNPSFSHGRFRSFGPLRYARITLDHESGRSRGTGFACFWNKSDADKVVEQSELLKVEMTGVDIVRSSPFFSS